MTASEKQNKISKEAPGLPGVFLLLKETLALYVKYSSFFLGYAAWLLIPVIISVLARTVLNADDIEIFDLLISYTLYFVLSIYVTVIFIKSIPYLRRKRPVSKKLVRTAMILSVPYLLAAILINLIFLVGLALLIVPGILFGIWFAFTGIIVVIEQTSIREALKKSKRLAKNRFWAVLWRYVGGGFLINIIMLLLMFIILYIPFAIEDGGTAIDLVLSQTTLAQDTAMRLINILFLPASVIYTTLLYLHLKENE